MYARPAQQKDKGSRFGIILFPKDPKNDQCVTVVQFMISKIQYSLPQEEQDEKYLCDCEHSSTYYFIYKAVHPWT